MEQSSAERKEESVVYPIPFKKAKYAWQIKGKKLYTEEEIAMDGDSTGSSGSSSSENKVKLPEDNLGLSPGCSTSKDGVFSDDDVEEEENETLNLSDGDSSSDDSYSMTEDENFQSLLSEMKGINSDQMQSMVSLYQNGGASARNNNNNNVNFSRPGSLDTAINVADWMTDYLSTMHRNDAGLNRWQRKQISTAMIDNILNKVLERMGFAPIGTDGEETPSAIPEVPDFNLQHIEHAGISEAIRQQGLQRRGSARAEGQEKPETLKETTVTSPKKDSRVWPPRWQQASCSSESSSSVEEPAAKISSPLPEDLPAVARSDELLDTAVTFAISEKGLLSLP